MDTIGSVLTPKLQCNTFFNHSYNDVYNVCAFSPRQNGEGPQCYRLTKFLQEELNGKQCHQQAGDSDMVQYYSNDAESHSYMVKMDVFVEYRQ